MHDTCASGFATTVTAIVVLFPAWGCPRAASQPAAVVATAYPRLRLTCYLVPISAHAPLLASDGGLNDRPFQRCWLALAPAYAYLGASASFVFHAWCEGHPAAGGPVNVGIWGACYQPQ